VGWKVVARCVLAPETGKAHLLTVDRRTGSTARRLEGEDRNRCLDIMSARRVKHDCRYPGAVLLQIRWTAVDVVEPRCTCCDRSAEPSQKNTMIDDLTIALLSTKSCIKSLKKN